jgi:hypothetical protein
MLIVIVTVTSYTNKAEAGNLYGVGSFGELYRINTQTGASEYIGDIIGGDVTTSGLAFDLVHKVLYAIDNHARLMTVDTTTGVGTWIGPPTGLSGNSSLTYNTSDGYLYTASAYLAGGDYLHKLDPATGNVTYVAATSRPIGALAYNGISDTMYCISYLGMTSLLYTIDPQTGTTTFVGDTGYHNMQGLTWDPNARVLYGARGGFGGPNELVKINPVTGAGSLIGPTPVRFYGLAMSEPAIIYVDADASGDNNGSSWEHAYNNLQDALSAAQSGEDIWVAEGTYMPDGGYKPEGGSHVGGGGSRYATFQLINGVAIYGGFAGNEDPATFDLNDRDFETYKTILSGDLNSDDGPDFANNGENSYHVVTGIGTDSTAVLDGFTITAGNANGVDPDDWGGGMDNYQGSPTVTNCTFNGNLADDYGGGMCNFHDSSPKLTNCTFSGNAAYAGGGMFNYSAYYIYSSPKLTNCTFSGNAAYYGGGMYNEYRYSSPKSSPELINCAFSGNAANHDGGGMYNYSSDPTLTNCAFSGNSARDGGGMCNYWYNKSNLTNCTFSGNLADDYGGGMYNSYDSSPTMENCIVWSNTATYNPQIYGSAIVSYSCIQDDDPDDGIVYPGPGNIDDDPLFVRNPDPGLDGQWGTDDDDYGDLHLQPGSPCIDVGDNSAVTVPTDLDGNPRIVNDVVDMGAYEFQMIPLSLDILPSDCPNLFTVNKKGKGRLPMAILGTDDLDVSDIDPGSISIAGVVFPQKTPSIKDVSAPVDGDECTCQEVGPDGYADLVIHFSRREVITALGLGAMAPGTEVPITVTGELIDGTPFEATDCVTLVGRKD